MEYSILAILKCRTTFNLSAHGDQSSTVLELYSSIGKTLSLNFWEVIPVEFPRFHESNETILVNLPINYFERLYLLLQEALNNNRFKVKFVAKQEGHQEVHNAWYTYFEFANP